MYSLNPLSNIIEMNRWHKPHIPFDQVYINDHGVVKITHLMWLQLTT
jgi:hypothetical protein